MPAVQAQRPLGYLPFPSSASSRKPCSGCGIRWTLIQTPASATIIFWALVNLLMLYSFPSCVEYLGIQTPTWQR